MNSEVEQIREQLHELRNYIGPLHIMLENMSAKIQRDKAELEGKIAELELKIAGLTKWMESARDKAPGTTVAPTRLAPEPPPGIGGLSAS
jgi:archaellum component FlaC